MPVVKPIVLISDGDSSHNYHPSSLFSSLVPLIVFPWQYLVIYSLDRWQTDLDKVSPAVDELVRQLAAFRVIFYHSVHIRIHATTEHHITTQYNMIIIVSHICVYLVTLCLSPEIFHYILFKKQLAYRKSQNRPGIWDLAYRLIS